MQPQFVVVILFGFFVVEKLGFPTDKLCPSYKNTTRIGAQLEYVYTL